MTDSFDPAILEGIPLPAFFVDGRARLVASNARVVELQPKASESLPLILVFRQPALNDAVEKCLRSRQQQRTVYLHNDGRQEHRYDVSITPAEGGALVCFRDITEERQLDQMRRDFVANVSHELRTPLTAILGFIETLQGPAKGDPNAQERFLGTMAAEASRMNRLVGDLLSLSRVEEVSRMRPTDPVDVDGLIRSAIRNLSPLAEESESQIVFDREASEMIVPGDSDQLLQVVTNLIENALKYGGEGTEAVLSLSEIDRATGVKGEALNLTISDNGPGIDDVHIPRLTERFYRIDSHRSREMGGTGLGLAIVKHIINRHRGRLEIESALGKGTSISVILPKN
ncbi:two-component system phosphate regulon sensor histidine kinase PhoR [Shimia isoporae]|uniref:histidine kinase n=1 Tax=Shimia isoporae TaxID=647720 RepID=A0A4R1NNP5_9RHOB|nr:ATP-binding protein [Shimia isoporae]TCL09441.1 two-component system phosphate regulon sensor histidine kinase PhoR [Shimia isoporae]